MVASSDHVAPPAHSTEHPANTSPPHPFPTHPSSAPSPAPLASASACLCSSSRRSAAAEYISSGPSDHLRPALPRNPVRRRSPQPLGLASCHRWRYDLCLQLHQNPTPPYPCSPRSMPPIPFPINGCIAALTGTTPYAIPDPQTLPTRKLGALSSAPTPPAPAALILNYHPGSVCIHDRSIPRKLPIAGRPFMSSELITHHLIYRRNRANPPFTQ